MKKNLITSSLVLFLIVGSSLKGHGQAALFVLIFGDKVATEKFHLSLDLGANYAAMVGYGAGNNQIGLNFGLGTHLKINDRWHFAPEFKPVSRKGARNLDIPFPIPPGVSTTEATSSIKLNYLEIPVLFQYQLPNKIYFSTGPQVGWLTSATQLSEVTLTSGTAVQVEQDVEDDFENFELSIPFEVAYSLAKVAGKKYLDVRARYTYGISEIFKESTGFSANNSTFQLILSFHFILPETK